MTFRIVCLTILCSIIVSFEVRGAKILLTTVPQGSSVNLYTVAANILKQHGHQVKMLVHPSLQHIVKKQKLDHFEYETKMRVNANEIFKKLYNKTHPVSLYDKIFLISDSLIAAISEIMLNENLQQEIADEKFDLMVADTGYDKLIASLAYKHDIPLVSLTPLPVAWRAGVPALPSAEPMMIPVTNRMSFFDRVKNFFSTLMIYTMFPTPFFVNFEKHITKFVGPKKPPISLRELNAKPIMWFINEDRATRGYPGLSSPNVVFLNALTTARSKPLPDHLQTLLDGATNGAVVLSFGGSFRELPVDFLNRFLDGFSRVNQRVIMVNKGKKPNDAPANVFMEPWLPQNDVLAHPNVKLFLTHAGKNGIEEAISNAVPMIAFPYEADRVGNAYMLINRGYGLQLDLHEFTGAELAEAINKITKNETYYSTMKRARDIMKSLPKGDETFIFWINHLLKFGGDHLRYPAVDMGLIEMLSLDVIGFLTLISIIVLYLDIKLLKFVCKKCCKTEKKKVE